MAATVEYRDDTGSWRVRYREAGRKRSIGGIATEREARRIATLIDEAHRRGETWRRGPATPPTYDEVTIAWVEWVPGRMSPGRAKARAQAHARFGGWFWGERAGTMRIDDFTLADLERYHASIIARGCSRLHAENEARAVHALRRWAAEREAWAGLVPTLGALTVGSATAVIEANAPTWDEADRVIAACAEPWHRDLLTVMRFTGLRVTQVMHLQWRDVDLRTATLRIRADLPGSKSSHEKKGRWVPLAPPLVAELATWGRREGWLIDKARTSYLDRSPGSRFDPDLRDSPNDQLVDAWTRAGFKVAGKDPDRFQPTHAFRKMFRTMLIVEGASGDFVAYLQGRNIGIDGDVYTAWKLLEAKVREVVAMVPPIGVRVVSLDAAREDR